MNRYLHAALFGLAVVLPGVLITSDVAAAEVTIETTSGETLSGMWAGVADGSVRLNVDGSERQIPFDQMVVMRPTSDVPLSDGPPTEVTLVDGSSIKAQRYAMSGETVTIEPLGQAAIEMPVDRVQSIRFRRSAAATDPQWLGLLEKEHRSDVMVIRRGNDQLDPIDGVIVAIDGETLRFELDGDKIDAPVERLEGVLFRTPQVELSRPTVKVSDRNGSLFLTAGLEPSDDADSVTLQLLGRVPHPIPLKEIDRITWASGRVLLAAEPPAERGYQPDLQIQNAGALIQQWFAPFAEGDDLIADAGGFVEYRVEDGFQKLSGSVVRDASVADAGKVQIRILVDGELGWQQTLSDAAPKGFSIPVDSARRIRMEVLSAGDGDVGDRVRFKKPRLLK